jgi:hypothetical protein
MTISTQSRKMLWGRAASRCAFNSCRIELAQISEAAGHAVVIGEEAHIVAQSPDGPRGDSPLTPQQRDEYSNLILMCPSHHTLIDKAPHDYSVQRLRTMKLNHERWVVETLRTTGDVNDERWAALVDELDRRLDVANWETNMSGMFSGYEASMRASTEALLRDCVLWIAKRPWPAGHETLKETIIRIGTIVNHLIFTFDAHAVRSKGDDWVRFEKFYHISEWNPDRYQQYLSEYQELREYMDDLTYELTKYVNLFSDRVRAELDPSYRYEDGYASLKIEGAILRFDTHIPRFSDEELTANEQPFDIETFDTVRKTRASRV